MRLRTYTSVEIAEHETTFARAAETSIADYFSLSAPVGHSTLSGATDHLKVGPVAFDLDGTRHALRLGMRTNFDRYMALVSGTQKDFAKVLRQDFAKTLNLDLELNPVALRQRPVLVLGDRELVVGCRP